MFLPFCFPLWKAFWESLKNELFFNLSTCTRKALPNLYYIYMFLMFLSCLQMKKVSSGARPTCLPVCKMMEQTFRGRGSWHPLSALLSWFCFLGGRQAHWLMLFAWPFIMHEMIHNLLSLVYHLLHINNRGLASCFCSICYSCLSNTIKGVQFRFFHPCILSMKRKIELLVCYDVILLMDVSP